MSPSSKIIRIANARLEKSKFLRNFLSVASANVFSQAMLLAATPLLTRLYLPEHFGVAALFLSAVQIVGSFCTWRFDRTVPNARSEIEAQVLCAFGMLACMSISCIIFFMISYNPADVIGLVGLDVLGSAIYLLPCALLATGIVELCGAWYARDTHLKPVSRGVVVYSVVYLSCGLLLGVLGIGVYGLVGSAVVALGCQVATLLYFGGFSLQSIKKISIDLRQIFLRHVNVASTAALVTLVNTISFALPVLLFSHIFLLSEVGLYVLMTRLVATPLGVITKSLSISFWSRSAELARENRFDIVWSLYLRVTLSLSILAVGIACFCLLVNRYIAFFLGDNWSDAGPVLVASIPYLVGLAIASPTNHLFVLKKQIYQLYADGLRIFLIIVILYISAKYSFQFTTTVLLVSTASLIGHAALFLVHVIVYRKKFALIAAKLDAES